MQDPDGENPRSEIHRDAKIITTDRRDFSI